MTHTDASHLVRETAKSIERGQLILSEEMRNASTEYCETYRRNIPQLLNMAADLLDEAGQGQNGKKTIVNQRRLEFHTGYCSYQGEKPLVEVHGFWATKGKRPESK